MQRIKRTLSMFLTILLIISILPGSILPAFAMAAEADAPETTEQTADTAAEQNTEAVPAADDFAADTAMEQSEEPEVQAASALEAEPNAASTAANTCGEDLAWTFDEATGTLTISGSGAMTDYLSSSDIPWHENSESIQKITICDGVTAIGSAAFKGCSDLISVTIPDSVTSIGDYAFMDCGSLADIYYGGTEEKTSITISETENQALTAATWHYEGEPAAKAAKELAAMDLSTATANEKANAITEVAIKYGLRVAEALGNDDFAAQVAAVEGSNAAEVSSTSSDVSAKGAGIVGASLSASRSDGSGVKLIIAAAEKDEKILAGYNASTAVLFSMTLEGASNSEKPKIAVLVTLPIPAGFQDDPYGVTVLQYSSDGSISEISPNVYWDTTSKQYVAAFPLTSFSDFAFVEKGSGSTPKYSVTYTDGVDGETIFANQKTGSLLSGTTTPPFVGTPARTGYVFTGWSPEVAKTVTGNAIYNATWELDENGNGEADKDEEKYTITYTDGVEDEEVFADEETENLLSGATTPAFSGTLVRTGYIFAGWSPTVDKTVTKSVTYTATWNEDESGSDTTEKEDTASTIAVTRLYNLYSGEHLLATSQEEIMILTDAGWSVDGILCNMPTSGTPTYRLYNPYSGEHLYTMVTEEIETLTDIGWKVDGIMCYSATAANGTPIYRLYNEYAPEISSHLLSTSQEEIDTLVAAGWALEGIALYAAK